MNRRQLLQCSAIALGGMVSGSLARAVVVGEAGNAKIKNPVFNQQQRNMVAKLTELIIPTTDTPGAITAGVPQFVELIVSDWYTPTERKIFLNGLQALDKHCLQSSKKDFSNCIPAQQTVALQQMEIDSSSYKSSGDAGVPMAPGAVDENTPFFTKLKELTVVGYYTSEIGSKEELSYNPVPVAYDGDLDFAEVGRQWSY